MKTMRGCEPHISSRLRNLFKRNGYETYKINEFNTSKLCNRCCCNLERYKRITDNNGNQHLLWGLLRCTNGNCKTIHNRDVNASRNMLKITRNIMDGKGRLKEYSRKQI
jgi:transposase